LEKIGFDYSSIIFGSSSEIAKWIIDGLDQINVNPICFTRSSPEGVIDFTSYNEVLRLIRHTFASSKNIKSVYFCIGAYAKSNISESDPNDWINDIAVNLNCAYICYRALSEVHKAFPTNLRFVFLGSTATVSNPSGYSSYAVSKSGLQTLTTYINNEPPLTIRACYLRLGTCKTRFSDSPNDCNTIDKNNIISCVHFLESVGFHVFPDLLSLRPIRVS